jgi:hypothetical protein
MKFLKYYILYRLQIIIFLIVFGIVAHLWLDAVLAWICYILAAISLTLYFMVGTMRIVQEAVMEGDVDAAMQYMKMIRFRNRSLSLCVRRISCCKEIWPWLPIISIRPSITFGRA